MRRVHREHRLAPRLELRRLAREQQHGGHQQARRHQREAVRGERAVVGAERAPRAEQQRLAPLEERGGVVAAHVQRVPPRRQPPLDERQRLPHERMRRAPHPAHKVGLRVDLCGGPAEVHPARPVAVGRGGCLRRLSAERRVGEVGVREQRRELSGRPIREVGKLQPDVLVGQRPRGSDCLLAQVDGEALRVEHRHRVVEHRRGPQPARRVRGERLCRRRNQRVAVLEVGSAEGLARAGELIVGERRLVPSVARVEALELVH